MSKPAILKRFDLLLNSNMRLRLHNVKVVKDSQRHVIHLIGNPIKVTLARDRSLKVYASSNGLGLFELVKGLPEFMIRLLS